MSSLATKKTQENFPFPYVAEKFTLQEKKVLLQFFTNVNKPIFAIFGLPQEVVGAMFSRYSRSAKSVRRLFLDEFWNSELRIKDGVSSIEKELQKAKERTTNFYRRVFAEFGDDSVIQMGSIHIAFEFVSQIAAKAIEDGRIGAAYIEKSTRYVDFGTKLSDHFLFSETPEIMQSKFSKEFVKWNNLLFETYVKNLPLAADFLRKKYPIEKQIFEDYSGNSYTFKDVTDPVEQEKLIKAYERALRAKAFDTVRIFLPTTTVTNLGAHYSGQAAEFIINKLIVSPFDEVRTIGWMAYRELKNVIPNFLQNIENQFGNSAREYRALVKNLSEKIANKNLKLIKKDKVNIPVKLVDYDKDTLVKIVSQIIYANQTKTLISKEAIFSWTKRQMKTKAGEKLLENILFSSIPDRSQPNYNRRHKLPRAFEHAFLEVEFFCDFGIYRDLQRNRLSSSERQPLSANEIFIPSEYWEKGMEKILRDYNDLAKRTKMLYKKLQASKNPELIRAAEYVTMLGNEIRFNVRANIRQWVFFSELRTIPGGHPSYRNALQEAVKQINKALPFTQKLFAKVDWTKDYGLGRLKAEVQTQKMLSEIGK